MNETNQPARRLRHGAPPTEPLTFEDAAANKAAEEGELPITRSTYGSLEACEAEHQRRAARPVANKAEVEPSDSYKAGYADGMDEGAKLAFWGDKPSEKFPEGWPSEIWLNAGDDELAPFSEYDELSWCSAPQGESDVRYIREDLLATPPATTGASTVLTDDRIWKMWQDDPCPGGSVKEMIISHTRAVLREVAAQAGQVAVPEKSEARYQWLREWFLRGGARLEIDPWGHVRVPTAQMVDEAIDAALAAPSPAKESK